MSTRLIVMVRRLGFVNQNVFYNSFLFFFFSQKMLFKCSIMRLINSLKRRGGNGLATEQEKDSRSRFIQLVFQQAILPIIPLCDLLISIRKTRSLHISMTLRQKFVKSVNSATFHYRSDKVAICAAINSSLFFSGSKIYRRSFLTTSGNLSYWL